MLKIPDVRKLLDEPGATTLVDWSQIRDWASDPDLGGLPAASARAFATWLNENWNNWTEDEEATVRSILEGAVTDWCGGRVMPS